MYEVTWKQMSTQILILRKGYGFSLQAVHGYILFNLEKNPNKPG